jgi:lysophospholipase L1-like esterase
VLILPAPVDLDSEPVPVLIDAYRNELKELADRHRLLLVDGPAVFTESSATNADFYDQVHPSVSGHRLLGDALARVLARTEQKD